MDTEEKTNMVAVFEKGVGKAKGKVILGAGVFAVVLVIILSLVISGYANRQEDYELLISQLREENAELAERPAAYDIATKEVRIDLIQQKVENIGELATIEYMYTAASKFEGDSSWLPESWGIGKKSFIAMWDGIIKAGVEVNEIQITQDKDNRTITLSMPEAKILSHEIDEDSMQTLDQKDGLFNPVKVEDVRTFDNVSKDHMEERAIENGVLEKAAQSAEELIYRLIYTEELKALEYSVVFEKKAE